MSNLPPGWEYGGRFNIVGNYQDSRVQLIWWESKAAWCVTIDGALVKDWALYHLLSPTPDEAIEKAKAYIDYHDELERQSIENPNDDSWAT